MRNKTVPEAELESLSDDQRQALQRTQLSLTAGNAGAAVGGLLMGGASVLLAVMSLIGGLLGYLLVMKKKVLQCGTCGAVTAAS